MADLTTRTKRRALPTQTKAGKLRDAPHWQRLSEGAYLGFRKGPETWLARYRGRDKVQRYAALGGPLEFDDAKIKAETWLAQIAGSTVRTVHRGTVKAALQAYLDDLRHHGRTDAAKAAEGIFKTVVYKDPIADVKLERATGDDFRDWQARLTDGRKPRSANRYVRSVVAGLNRAIELGHLGKPSAWHLTPLGDDTDDESETAVFLSPEQRKALLAASTPAAALFFRGLATTGARPKELAAALVRHFDGNRVRLAHKKGKPPKLRIRHSELGPEGIEFFAQMASDRPGTDLLFTDAGRPWTRGRWAEEVRAAVSKHNEKAHGKARLPDGIGAYAFRHARISELLQKHGVDPLTVAAQTGTSVVVIEKNYFKFIPSAMRAKLTGVKES
jgi:integrase